MKWCLVSICFLFGLGASASPETLTYQGRIVKADGTPLEYTNVAFIFQIANPSGACVIYQEQYTGYDMAGSKGVFDVPIGSGTVAWPTGGGFSVLDAFNNSSTFTCGSCSGYSCAAGSGSYNPLLADGRVLKVQFYDGNGWKAISPNTVIRSVPFAGYSLSAQKLGTHEATSFVLKNEVNSNASCDGGSQFLTWNATTKTFGCSGVSGTNGGTVTTVTAAAPLAVSAGTESSTPHITIQVASASQAGSLSSADWTSFNNKLGPTTIFVGDISGTASNISVDKIKGVAVATSGLSTGDVLKYSGGQWINGPISVSEVAGLNSSLGNKPDYSQFPTTCTAAQTLTFVSPVGGFTCTDIAIPGAQVSGNISGTAAGFTGSLSGDVTGTQSATVVSKLRGVDLSATAPTGNQVLKYNGSQWAPASLDSSDLPSGTLSGAGTAGAIPYYSAASTLASSEIYQTGGNIGIGTIVPSEKLDVAGKVKAHEFCIGNDCVTSWPSGAGGAGTVTNIATGTGLTGGPITATGTISIADGGVGTTQLADGAVTQEKLATVSGLSAGTYGDATNIPSITVDTKGRVTAVTTNAVAALPAPGGASGKFLKSDGTSWSGQDIRFSDIKNIAGTSAFNIGACGANQTVAWSSLTDSFSCQLIGNLDADKITSGTLDMARLPSSVTNAFWSESGGNVYRSSGNVGIGTSSPSSAAVLDLSSTTRGFLPPRMTTAQISAISSPSEGLIVFNTTTARLNIYSGGAWKDLHTESEVSFSVNKNGNDQTVATSTDVLVTWSQAQFDTTSSFDFANNRFRPAKEGRYLMTANLSCYPVDSDKWCVVRIRKNGNVVSQSSTYSRIAGSNMSFSTSVLVSLNGTTDYVDVVANTNSATPLVSGVAGATNFSGYLINGAFAAGSGGGGSADNLGDHTLTQNLVTGSRWISGDGGNEGIRIDNEGNVAIGAAPSSASALLDLVSSTKGLLAPRMTEAERDAIVSPAAGLMVYNTTTQTMNIFNGSLWGAMGAGSLGNSSVATAHIQNNAVTLDKIDFSSTTKGLGLPTMTTAQINAISSPTAGMVVFNSTTGAAQVYSGSVWKDLVSSTGSSVAPSISVVGSGSQSVTSNTMEKMTFSTVEFDTNSNWSAANNRFTPTVAGKYIVTLSSQATSSTLGDYNATVIYKNGVATSGIGQIIAAANGQGMATTTAVVVDMNGSTDYIEGIGQTSATAIYGKKMTAALLTSTGGSGGGGSVGGTGTANYLPLWSSSTNLGNSPLAVSGSNVGIGTTNPTALLHVNGMIESSSGGVKFPDGTIQTTAASSFGHQVKLGSFMSPVTTGNYSVSGLGFKPTFVRFWIQYHRAGAMPAVAVNICTGSMTATDQQALFSYVNTGSANTARNYIFTDRVLACSGGDATDILVQATRTSLDPDGFTINFSAVGGASWRVNYEASGGSTTASAGSGTAGYVPLWSTSTALGNSPLAVSGGNVGIGTTNPLWTLDVTGAVRSNSLTAKASGTTGSISLQTGSAVLPGYIEWRNPAADGVAGVRRGYMGWDATNIALNLENSSNFTVNGGNLGVGVNPGYKLHVYGPDDNGTISFYNRGRAVFTGDIMVLGTWMNSDERLKEEIHDLSLNEMSGLLALEPKTYYWKDRQRSEKLQYGLIAQQVQKYFPSLVSEDPNGYWTVNYQGLFAPVLGALKQVFNKVGVLEQRADTQEREIASVKAENAIKDQKIQRLEKENDAKTQELTLMKSRLEAIEKMLKASKEK